MAPRAPKKCGRTGCEQRVTGRRYCDTHTAEHQARTNTTARGYGADHQARRRAALQRFIPGQPCPRCGEPMHDPTRLDLDHTDDRTGYLGLAHRRCNTRAGAKTKARGSTPPRHRVG